MVLWGSLNQLLIPFIAFAAFYYKRDREGTTFALLWFFGNFSDIIIYMMVFYLGWAGPFLVWAWL